MTKGISHPAKFKSLHSILDSRELVPNAHANPPIYIHQVKLWEAANEGKNQTQYLSASLGLSWPTEIFYLCSF